MLFYDNSIIRMVKMKNEEKQKTIPCVNKTGHYSENKIRAKCQFVLN